MSTYVGFEPVWDGNSRLLILGSFPSVKSREEGFYYGHPRNRFWPLLARILKADPPQTVNEKRSLLLANRIALWDVCASCEIVGSSDASIRNVIPNDLGAILAAAPITRIVTNGKTADRLYRTYQYPNTGIEAICLPSTSPANAAFGMERLLEAWQPVIADGIMK